MSWEEMGTREYPCECGRGKKIVTWYMDDWNRTKDSERIECDFCNSHHLYINERPNGTTDRLWIPNEIYASILEQQRIIQDAQHRIEEIVDSVRYHEEYSSNLDIFHKSAIRLKKGNAIRKEGKTICVEDFKELPIEVQERALGKASKRSPYAINVLCQVPIEYWSDYEEK